MKSLLKGFKDAMLPTSLQTNTITHLLKDNMGVYLHLKRAESLQYS